MVDETEFVPARDILMIVTGLKILRHDYQIETLKTALAECRFEDAAEEAECFLYEEGLI